MIKSFRHAGTEHFYRTGSKSGINPQHAMKLFVQLTALQQATTPDDMKLPGWALHALKGSLLAHWSIKVSGNWRLTFRFDGMDVILVDYQDYH